MNIIFIIADTLRSSNIGIYGRKPSPSPNIDRLGKEGVTFTNTYGVITKSDASTVAIMTGKYPLSFGLIGHGRWLKKEQIENLKKTSFLPQILQKHGYKTAAIDWLSRWHKWGYDYYSGKLMKDVDLSRLIDDNVFFLKQLRWLDLITIRLLRRDFFVRFYYCFFSKTKSTYDPADVVVDKAIEILEKNKKNKLFLYIRFRDPHFPHVRPRGLRSYLFDGLEKRYEAEITFMDEQIGRLLNYLKKEKLDDSLIIFTSDHGESLYEHGIILAHRGLYENVVKIPLIIKHPLLPAKKIRSLVQQVDILPTVLDLLGISCPPNIDGQNLLPLISGKKKRVRDFAFFEDISFGELVLKKSTRKRGIRIGRYKYIETLMGKDDDLFTIFPSRNVFLAKEEIYDLSKDYFERNNLIEEKPIIAEKMSKRLRNFVSLLARKNWRKKI